MTIEIFAACVVFGLIVNAIGNRVCRRIEREIEQIENS
jgi:hypothetical protein